VTSDGSPVDLGTSKQRAIFALLALRAGEPTTVETLAAALWGDCPPPNAVPLLQTYVARLRRVLEPHAPRHARTNIIASSPGAYRLELHGDRIDVVRFRRLTEAADKLLLRQRRSAAFELLVPAVASWADPPLADLRTLLPGHEAVAALRREWVTACQRMVSLGSELRRPAEVMPVAERLAAAEPLNESVQARYVTALLRFDRRDCAAQRYAEICARLAGELGMEPGPELLACRRELDRARPPAGPVTATSRPAWKPLRPDPGELIGRASDLRAVAGLIADRRVTTVTGPAGSGKSALASAVSRTVRDSYPGGVVHVDLSGTRSPVEAGSEVRRRVPEPGTARPATARGHGDLLLVLDNADHLTDTCAALVDELVRAGRNASALVTSREPLGLGYETVWRLSPLPAVLTEPGGVTTMPAVQLFARRAQQARPGFRMGGRDIRTVAAICARLDWLPLAVELAADRMADESPAELLRRLDDLDRSPRRLRRGDLPPYRAPVFASLQRSLDSLTPAERWCFERLSRLPRTFRLDDVDRVCDSAPWWRTRTQILLDGLVRKSLLTVRSRGGGVWYAMLRTVHQFARMLYDEPAPG
jgi:predicted ATPase/DNA-binding SARP family transcriptional activator